MTERFWLAMTQLRDELKHHFEFVAENLTYDFRRLEIHTQLRAA